MLTIRACTTPKPEAPMPQLPKRVARVRRALESKRLDSFRELHETLKKTAKDEHEFVKDFFTKTREMFKDEEEEEENKE
jgi:chemotaxis methyl-accepting protein methylase